MRKFGRVALIWRPKIKRHVVSDVYENIFGN